MRKYTSQSVVTQKRSRLTFAQSSVTGLYGVRHSPLYIINSWYEAIRLFSSKASPFTSHYEFICSTCKLIFCVLHFYVVGAFDKGNVS